MVTILMISAKLATLGLQIKVFRNKSYDGIIFAHDLTNKILSCDSYYIVEWTWYQSLVTLEFLWEISIIIILIL